MQTRFTRAYNVRFPIVLPPMAGASGGKLAAAVTQAGGLGFVAGGHTPLGTLKKEVGIAKEQLQCRDGDRLPFGVGLLMWRLEAAHGNPALADEFMNYLLEIKPAAIWMSFGDELERWVQLIRSRESERNKIFIVANSVAEAQRVETWDVDVVVIQGTESGGHGPSYQKGLPLLSILAAVYKHYRSVNSKKLVLAAGGIATGRQLVSVLPFADGAVLGTTFLATPEALYSDAQKQLIVGARGEDTIRTMRFDQARGTLGWGQGVDGRGLTNETVTGAEHGEELIKVYDAAAKTGDVKRIVTWSGTSVGLVDQIKPAAQWVQDIAAEAQEALQDLASLTSS